MVDASPARTSFLGGEWSKAAQGRFDREDYPSALNVCTNFVPVESGALSRRSGSRWANETRNGLPGRVANFNFRESAGYKIEFTDGYMRFRTGPRLIDTNDEQTVSSISSANPAVVDCAANHDWATGEQVQWDAEDLASEAYPLLNRTFIITVTASDKFTMVDAISGEAVDGADIACSNAGTVRRVREIVTPYVGSAWATLRVVQADIVNAYGSHASAFLLHSGYKPYLLQVVTEPTNDDDATFTFEPAVFKDGPYLDPVPGGTLATPSGTVGIINVTLAFNAYSSTVAYAKGDYVTDSSINYKSLQDANLNNTPASSAAYWEAVEATDAIGPDGFQGSDAGRMIRLLSEPAEWASGTAYSAGQQVRYGNPSTYWVAVGSSTGVVPGHDTTKWIIDTNAAQWTWGKITGLSNIIDRALSGSTNIGDMASGGGLAGAFNGNFSQVASTSAQLPYPGGSVVNPDITVTNNSYVGKDYTGASSQRIASATVYPSSDFGLFFATYTPGSSVSAFFEINLYASNSAPSTSNDGTLLGTLRSTLNTTSPITIQSNDSTTAWDYVWIELIARFAFSGSGSGGPITFAFTNIIGQVSFFGPPGTGTSAGVSVQILGDALPRTTPIRTWRLGVFSDTTGWPRCGVFHEGRLWLSGVVGNRIDGSRSNDVFNFAPTEADGTVVGSNGISYVFNSKDVNPVFWMESDDLGIVCGTQGGEWLAQATTANAPLTPTTMQAHRVTKYGCANIEPARTELALAMVQTFRRQVLEYFGEVMRGKFTAQNLTEMCNHFTQPKVAQLDFQQEQVPTLWARMDDGTAIGMTYKRKSLVSSDSPDARGAWRLTLGSSRKVESIAVGPSDDGAVAELAMVTANTADPVVRYVEIMQPMFEEGDALANAFFLDAAIVPPVYVAGVDGVDLYGLWPHNDETVSVFAGGLYLGEFDVEDGTINLPYGDGVAGTAASLFTSDFVDAYDEGEMPVVVGFKFTSQAQVTRPMTPLESGARTGPALGKTRRINKYAAMLVNAIKGTVSFGGRLTGTLYPAIFKEANGDQIAPNELFTGIHKNTLNDDYTFDGMLAWQISDPYPATIAAVEPQLQTQDA